MSASTTSETTTVERIEQIKALLEAAGLTGPMRVRIGYEGARHVPIIEQDTGLHADAVARTYEADDSSHNHDWPRAQFIANAASNMTSLLAAVDRRNGILLDLVTALKPESGAHDLCVVCCCEMPEFDEPHSPDCAYLRARKALELPEVGQPEPRRGGGDGVSMATTPTTNRITAHAVGKAIETWRPDSVVLPLSPRLRRSLAEHLQYGMLLVADCAVQAWTVLLAHDDGGEDAGHGIYVEGYEDEGWLIAGLDEEVAKAIVELHNRERDDVMALFGEEV